MVYTVTITRQGQISIPAKLRRLYGLEARRELILRPTNNDQIIIEPVRDLLSFRGYFKTKKRFSKKQIRRAFENYLASRHRR